MNAESLAVGVPVTRSEEAGLDRFEQIVRRHERAVVRVAWRMTGNIEEAKDVAQDVFLKLHRNLRSIEGAADVAPWLYRVTVNTANDLLRKRKPMLLLNEEHAAPQQTNPEAATLASERHDLVLRAVACLPEKERAAVVLRDVEGLSTAQVAAILGTEEVTVRSQISSARVKLRRIVNELMGKKR